MVNGKDEMSFKIMTSLNKGTRIKDIPSMFPVSLDQAKRISRFNNMINLIKKNLGSQAVSKFKQLGLKGLPLTPVIREKDWSGLQEILDLVDESTTRDYLIKIIQALKIKKKRVSKLEGQLKKKLYKMKEQEEKLKSKEKSIKEVEKEILNKVSFIRKYDKRSQDFLLKHLGVFESNLVLSHRIDSLWQKNLKNKGILKYDNDKFIWIVMDLDKFVSDYEKRINRKVPYPTEWDYEREIKRQERFNIPSSPKYRLPDELATDFQSELHEIEKEKKEIESNQLKLKTNLEQIRKTSPKSFIEKVHAADVVSSYDLRRHGELQELALRWLYNRGYVAASEITLPNNSRVDVIGYNEQGKIIIIEVKTSRNDLVRDKKWKSYLHYCHEFYFLLDFDYQFEDHIYEGIGVLDRYKQSLKVIKKPNYQDGEYGEVNYSISRSLSQKFIFG